jgi:hypothetical protein
VSTPFLFVAEPRQAVVYHTTSTIHSTPQFIHRLPSITSESSNRLHSVAIETKSKCGGGLMKVTFVFFPYGGKGPCASSHYNDNKE